MNNGINATELAERLELSRLPVEGTFYRQTYRSAETLENGDPAGTAMIGLYSVDPPSFSRFHRLDRRELWHFYLGDPLEIILLFPDGSHRVVVMGTDIAGGELVQFEVPAGVWQAARVKKGGILSLYGCTLAPGFTPECFEAGTAELLLPKYPDMEKYIAELASLPGEVMPADVDG